MFFLVQFCFIVPSKRIGNGSFPIRSSSTKPLRDCLSSFISLKIEDYKKHLSGIIPAYQNFPCMCCFDLQRSRLSTKTINFGGKFRHLQPPPAIHFPSRRTCGNFSFPSLSFPIYLRFLLLPHFCAFNPGQNTGS